MRLGSRGVHYASVLAVVLMTRGSAVPGETAPWLYWSFDHEPAPPAESVTAALRAPSRRAAAVHGSGLILARSHRLRVSMPELPGKLSALSFSAWVRPTRFDRYNEIFRQECDERLLFSFQEDGKVLSLGLNVNGYTECDARLEPRRVLDGAWHYCAATFDGRTMRVYFDGRQIGQKQRTGTIRYNASAPAFIGSQAGRNEFFQGGMDEVAVFTNALSAEAILEEYRAGVTVLAGRADRNRELVAGAYRKASGFAETLASVRERLTERGQSLDGSHAGLLNQRFNADFPEETGRFAELTKLTPFEFAAATDAAFVRKTLASFVGLVTEYRPLTEVQWARQTPEQRAYWEEVDALVEPVQAGIEDGTLKLASAACVAAILELGSRVQHRPAVQEAVAPYRLPETPPDRRLTAEEAAAALERDWLHQAGGRPGRDRVRDEIRWARELAARITANHPGRVDFSVELAELEKVSGRLKDGSASEIVKSAYLRVRAIKRAIFLRNPVVDFDEVLFVDMPFPAGREWRHETRHRLGYMAVPGARLMVLSGLSPDGAVRRLMPRVPLHGSFWRPDLSYDASNVLFCFKPHNEKSFHLYEIGIDGSGLRQLSDGPYDDLDPVYLPDGEHIVFSTTRGHTYVRCMPPTSAYILARCDRDGKNIYIVSRNNEPDYLPSVMDDGRVVYTRWEYTDKPLWRAQGLWTMNPDGTQVNTLWGNQSVWPDLLKDARSVPGSRRIMFTGSAHHNWFAGSVGLLDPALGLNFPDGLTKVTADTAWPESGNGPVDPVESPRYHAGGRYSGYYSPFPLSEKDFLVSAERGGKFVLYLMDVDGNRELVYEGHHNVLHAMPVRPRARPPVIPDGVTWPGRESADKPNDGVLFSRNVYEGTPDELHGRARYLRVLAIQPKTYTYWHKRPYLSTGPVVSAVQSDGVKEIVGTVPIRADGSVSFRLPSGKAFHFQLLDERHRALQTMRSFTGVMPGEVRGCLGCHEKHHKSSYSADLGAQPFPRPDTIEPPPWEDRTIGYTRYVRPVLNEYCGKCHTGDGKGRKTFDQTRRPGKLGFDELYWILTGHPSWGRPYKQPSKPVPGWGIAGVMMVEAYDQRDPEGYRTPPPMTSLSYKSRLVELAGSGKHRDVKVDELNLRRLKVWVDAMCPYRGEEEVRAIPDPEFQGVDWLAVRPRIATAPRIVRPGPVD